MKIQAWSVGLVLVLAGYAWHDALRGRFPWAGPTALAGLITFGLVALLLNLPVVHLVLVFAAAPAIGWTLRWQKDGLERTALLPLDVCAGVFYSALAAAVALSWTLSFMIWSFAVLAVLVALRITLVDPLLAWWAACHDDRLE